MAKAKKTSLDKNIEKFINENFDKRDRNKEESKHFEWFSNSMHICYHSSVFLNSDSKIGQKIGLGTSEGVDSFFISINEFQKIFSLQDDLDKIIDYIKDLKNDVKSIKFHFIQSKKTNSIGWSQVLYLFEIPYKIWNGEEFDNSQPVLKKVQEFIDAITEDSDPILKTKEHKLEIVFYTNKNQPDIDNLEKDWKTNINSKLSQLKEWFGDNVDFKIRGFDFLNSVYQKVNSNDYQLIISKGNVIEVGNNYLIGYVTAKELLDGIAPVINNQRTLYADVFQNNIRLYLGSETSVNKGIEKTLKEEASKFHYYNNGLTITTLDINGNNSKNYSIKPVNIVNGCQTANSIYSIAKSNVNLPLDEIKIPVRIIQTENEDYDKITIRTNSQNGVDIQDLISITDIQKDLEEKFKSNTYHNKSFIYKRQKSKENNFDADLVVQIDDILRAAFSTIMIIPNKVSGYFDKTTAKYIENIFDDSLTDVYIITTALLKLIEEKIDEDSSEFSRLKYHILYLMYKFLNKDIDIMRLEDFIRKKSDYEDEEVKYIHSIANQIINNLNKILSDKFKFDSIFDFILNKIRSNYPDFLDLSTKTKEKILYKPVEKLYRIRTTPVFENFNSVFNENLDEILNSNSLDQNANTPTNN